MLYVKDISNSLLTHPSNTYAFRDTKTINTIVIHQTDGADNGSFTPYAIAQDHVNNNGWAGIGYHYVITDSGQIYLTQNTNKISYHASGYNTNSIGVAITGAHRRDAGETNKELVGSKEYNSLVYLVAKLKEKYNIPLANIIGHNETGSPKSCPNLDMNEFRGDVKKKIILWNAIRVSGVLLGITFVVYGVNKYYN
jgi:N-acetylmuramoyl-L-alanine amidase